MNKTKTIICDIDGTLVEHLNKGLPPQLFTPPVLEGTISKLTEWDTLGYNIILITGRRESHRKITEEYLSNTGIIYDQLIMGVGGGTRVLINDLKPNRDEKTAIAINLTRNEGIKDVQI